MTDSMNLFPRPLEELEEYVSSLKRAEEDLEAIEEEIKRILRHILSEVGDPIIKASICQMQEKEVAYHEAICECTNTLDEYLSELEKKLNCYAPPFIPFTNIDIATWWEQAYPIIEQISTVAGAATVVGAPIVFIKWIRGKLKAQTEKSEYSWIKLILNEDEWNVSILSEKMNLSEDEIKRLLKGFGYAWNPKKMLYTSTDETEKLRDIKTHQRRDFLS